MYGDLEMVRNIGMGRGSLTSKITCHLNRNTAKLMLAFGDVRSPDTIRGAVGVFC